MKIQNLAFNFFHLTSQGKCKKWTGGDEKTRKQAGEEGKGDCEKKLREWASVTPNFLSWSLLSMVAWEQVR